VRVIIGFGPGATADITLRTLTPKLGSALGQQFVVETDRRRQHLAPISSRCAQGRLHAAVRHHRQHHQRRDGSELNFDFAKDFAPITLTATVPNILVVHPSIGVKSVDDLIRLVKAKPDGLSYGSSAPAPRCISRPSCST